MGDYGRRSRGGGEDRFYSPPAMRRQQKVQQQQQQQQLDHQSQLRLGQGQGQGRRVGSGMGSDDGAASSSSNKMGMGSVSAPVVENLTNLDRFIEHTTPRVPAQFLSKTSMRERKNYDGEFHPYFVLDDLWESFKEWSAYGAGVPLILNGSEYVVQYYVPYLSGIQLYIDPSKPVIGQRRPGEESDVDSSRDTSSDGSDEVGVDGTSNVQGTLRLQNHSGTGALAEVYNRTFLKNYALTEFSGIEKDIKNPPGLLIFEYFAHDPPYGREPLVDKILQLASQCPDLKTYKSCDLTTASWISVAWYPIYRIPMGPTLQSLDACFLTYHSLSTPLTRAKNIEMSHLHGSTSSGKIQDTGMTSKLALPPFALASYRFRISFWTYCGNCESQKANSLKQAAENWLRQLHVIHPDYRFFQSHSSYLL